MYHRRMKMYLQIKDFIDFAPDYPNNKYGLFYDLFTKYYADMPYLTTDSSKAVSLDYYTHSGFRAISPMLDCFKQYYGEGKYKISNAYKDMYLDIINRRYILKWKKIYATFTAQYNPIENYNRVETHTGTDTTSHTNNNYHETITETPTNWKESKTETPNNWKETKTDTPNNWKETKTDTPNDWKTTTEGDSENNHSDTSESVYGFNSATATPKSDTTVSASNKQETTQTGTFETETSRTGTYETETSRTGTYETETSRTGTYQTDKTESGSKSDSLTHGETINISGNIGVTTSQQMLEQERQLFMLDFWDMVFRDVDNINTLQIYY